MKKNWIELLLPKVCSIVLLLLVSLSGFSIMAQSGVSQEQSTLKLAFNEALTPEKLGLHRNDLFNWEVKNEKNELVADQRYGSIFSFVFSHPGNYFLSVQNVQGEKDHACSHHGFSGNWLVVVSPISVIFDVNTLTFSQRLTSEGIVSGIKFSIPVEVKFYNHQKIEFPISMLNINFQGVDCEVNVQAKNPTTNLVEGQHILEYSVIGKARKQSYIMIDCVDHNGNITTYYHLDEL